MGELHDLLRVSFQELETWLLQNPWRGKEHDCVNLFAHRFLAQEVSPHGPLYDLGQIGIEVGVRQPHNYGHKPSARKDLVIWHQPNTTAWNASWEPVAVPATIIEWKTRRTASTRPRIDAKDLECIQAYAVQFPDFRGYCATVDFTATDRRVFTVAVSATETVEDFHRR